MAVTKATYTATATWTASTLAGIFRSAFIDAGLMTEWHDSFLNTVENRVLEVQYNGAKTYGKTYYWFQFTTGGVFYSQATGWNTGSDIPSGTQYLDYFSTTTNATTNHVQFLSLTASTTVTLTRYTSGNHTAFVLRSGSSYYTFMIDHAAVSLQSWMDLDKGYHNGLTRCRCIMTAGGTTCGAVFFATPYRLRRSFLDGCVNNGGTAVAINYTDEQVIASWGALGAVSITTQNTITSIDAMAGAMILPYGHSASNSAFSSDFNPVYTGLRHMSTVAANLPDDFGFFASRASNTLATQDVITVTPGVEVWEVVAFANGGGTTGQVSPVFAARTT